MKWLLKAQREENLEYLAEKSNDERERQQKALDKMEDEQARQKKAQGMIDDLSDYSGIGNNALIDKYDKLKGTKSLDNPYLDGNDIEFRRNYKTFVFFGVASLMGLAMEWPREQINLLFGTNLLSIEIFIMFAIATVLIIIVGYQIKNYYNDKKEAIANGFSCRKEFCNYESIVLYSFDTSTLNELGNKVLNIAAVERNNKDRFFSLYELNAIFIEVAKENGFERQISAAYENRNNKKIILLAILSGIKNKTLRLLKRYLFVIPSVIAAILAPPVAATYLYIEYCPEYVPYDPHEASFIYFLYFFYLLVALIIIKFFIKKKRVFFR